VFLLLGTIITPPVKKNNQQPATIVHKVTAICKNLGEGIQNASVFSVRALPHLESAFAIISNSPSQVLVENSHAWTYSEPVLMLVMPYLYATRYQALSSC